MFKQKERKEWKNEASSMKQCCCHFDPPFFVLFCTMVMLNGNKQNDIHKKMARREEKLGNKLGPEYIFHLQEKNVKESLLTTIHNSKLL